MIFKKCLTLDPVHLKILNPSDSKSIPCQLSARIQKKNQLLVRKFLPILKEEKLQMLRTREKHLPIQALLILKPLETKAVAILPV